ncbi:MAG: hypothetical protein QOJ12_2321 [Thermoleophilales bacterium]|nr:hypothetical protein [Thermoleophilales bacterium]
MPVFKTGAFNRSATPPGLSRAIFAQRAELSREPAATVRSASSDSRMRGKIAPEADRVRALAPLAVALPARVGPAVSRRGYSRCRGRGEHRGERGDDVFAHGGMLLAANGAGVASS